MNIIFRKIKSGIWRMLGIDKMQADLRKEQYLSANLRQEVDTLQFFLNSLNDVSTLPPTTNSDLRVMQECDALLLRIFDKICKKHKMTYWLDWGTLLGAVRHRGFIPWDDDMDISMTRSDYQNVLQVLREELGDRPFDIKEDVYYPEDSFNSRAIGLGYRHQQTGVWLDIYALDEMRTDMPSNTEIKQAMEFYSKCGNWDEVYTNGETEYLYLADPYHNYCFRKDTIFPLTTISFEGAIFAAPNKSELHVATSYPDYKLFPKSGVLHHDMGRGNLHTWAKKNGVDMKEVKNELENILKSI